MREIELSPTKNFSGELEPNDPVRVYDCSGPWGDPDFEGDSSKGLPALRASWIEKRGDTASYAGREVQPMDNGYLSGKHAEFASTAERNRLIEFPGLKSAQRQPRRASAGHPVTQLWYARQGIITPEMEFIAIRENMGRAQQTKLAELDQDIVRNELGKQHVLSLLLPSEGVSEYETALLYCMPVKVKVDVELSVSVLLHQGLLSRIDSRLPFWVRVQIESIQVVVVGVEAEVASRYPIGIE
jgi:phosphomethylpyrimidine synthase